MPESPMMTIRFEVSRLSKIGASSKFDISKAGTSLDVGSQDGTDSGAKGPLYSLVFSIIVK